MSLRDLAEQLWFGADEGVRFEVGAPGRRPPAGYRVVEAYAVVPSVRSPRMLLPTGPAAAARGSAANYLRLRGPRERAVRRGLALAAALRIPTAPTTLRVLVPSDRPSAGASLPLQIVTDALRQGPLRASIGVRTGANRKATLQLVRTDGTPAGYAKLGWNATSDRYVSTERAALEEVHAAGTGRVRVPRLLAALEHAGHPVVVTEPLPAEVRAVRPDRDAPTPVEVHDLAPIARTDRFGSIGQVRALRERLATLTSAVVDGPAGLARALLEGAAADDPELLVAVRWHGDFTAWNTARDADGTLWVWDWESCEPDAPAGLDALHWAFSIQREAVGPGGIQLTGCVAGAAPQLVAAGIPRRSWDALVRVYLAVTIERACGLAAEEGGWDRLWIKPHQLEALVAQVQGITATS